MKFHVLSVKLRDSQRDDICNQIKANGDDIVKSPQEAEVVLTALKSADRIARHVPKELLCKVVSADWVLKDGMDMKRLDACVIETPRSKKRKMEVIVLSSEDESAAPTLPRQIRSWDELKDLYSQRCQDPVSSSTVISGYRSTSKAKLTKEESYQTTTSHSSFEGSNPQRSDYRFTTDEGTSDEDREQHQLPLVYDDGSDEGDTVMKFGRYACQRPSNWNPYNHEIAALFEFLEHARELQGDMMNARSYRIAASVIKAYPKNIKSAVQAQKLRGIGKKTGRIIADFLHHGKVEDIDALKNDAEFKLLETFYNVHGVGAATAREWISKGYRSLDDVREKEGDSLCKDVQLGLKYYEDFKTKIPRATVELIAKTVRAFLDKHFPGSKMTICGSYRRGKPESGDVDLVLAHRDEAVSGSMLVKLIELLKQQDYVTDILSIGSDCQLREPGMPHVSPDQALCVWRQPGTTIFRRVDFVVAPFTDYPISILAWTGSAHFERSIRLYAKQVMNIKVTSHGLYSRSTGRKLTVVSERHAFEILSLPWLEPTERNC